MYRSNSILSHFQSLGGHQMETKTWETHTTASTSIPHGDHGRNGNAKDQIKAVHAHMIPLPLSI